MKFKKSILASALLVVASASAFAAVKSSTVEFNVSAKVPDAGFNFYAVGIGSADTVTMDYNSVSGKLADKFVKLGFTGKADVANDLKASVRKSELSNSVSKDYFDLDVTLVNGLDSSKSFKLDYSPKSVVTATADADDVYKNLQLKLSQPATKSSLTEGTYNGTLTVLFEAGV
ncbi:hypothetical protein VCSRO62_0167 [Vibrio cholerae]|uniref:hypothetical protein n=1 Tax=Vibrio TaxID=662 RepID=UPI000DE4D5AA|nr:MULTISPECIES: hypothetical protein [Vibrio]RBM56881.1 hypothetical protein DLR71_19270 [Vibrio paracholerae]TXY16329.1 hypothetical protein FXE97_05425 [Vibrio cholerae]GHX29483.1 hypothetical protein VCSRO62_0167 [Vibrio cholerae]GHY08275.1 hypothetical protein VCSRO112_1901 [Vibrio cholerae]